MLTSIDHEFTRFTSRVLPYPIDEVWPHIAADYVELQEFIHASQDTASPVRAVPGDPNVIEFDWNGQKVLEKLVVQDDQNYVWAIQVPGETDVFKRYVATLTFIPVTDNDTTLATLELKMVLQKHEIAPDIFPAIDALILERLPRLEEFIHLKHGKHTMKYAEEVRVPTDKLWSVISNWNDINWVMGAQSVKVDPADPYLRDIVAGNGSTLTERLVAKNDDTHTMVYQMLTSNFPVSFYRATLHIEQRTADTSSFEYNLLFTPTGDAAQTSKVVLDRLKAGVHFINTALS